VVQLSVRAAYLVITVGSVTHRNLLFESPVKLPFLGVELPLLGFFILGPAIFLIVHAYVLLHFAMLADKVGVFHAELLAQIATRTSGPACAASFRATSSCSFLPGRARSRTGLNGAMLRLIALVSLVIGPLALLVLLQIQFLPYHHEAVTWWQRIAVVADLALLWALWPSVARGETAAVGWRDFKRIGVIAAAAASLVPLVLVFTIATFPGEWLDSNLPSIRFVPGSSDNTAGFAGSVLTNTCSGAASTSLRASQRVCGPTGWFYRISISRLRIFPCAAAP
jgi:hypothetical protein